MSRLSMKDGRIVLDDQSEKPKSTTQKTSANDSRLSMVDGRIVLADRAPVNTAKNQSYLQRTQKAQQEYLAMDDYTPQRRSSNVMEMAINSLRNRLANSTAGNATREWASRMSNTYQTIANETPVERARRQQARVDRAALIDQIPDNVSEARRQQWAIDNAQLIDQASSMYEGPTRTERVRGRNYDTSGADMFSNDWEPGAMQEHDYLRTVRNERYNPLSREDRDDLINRYADAVNGNVDANTYQQILYDVAKNGGIEQLYREQQSDAANDREYGRQLRGVDLDSMSFLQRVGGTLGGVAAASGEQIASSGLGLVASGLNREASIATQEYGPALEQTARRWFYGLVNGADDPSVEEQIRTVASYAGVDGDALINRIRDRAEQAKNSDEDVAVFAYGLLDGLEADQDKIWENAQQSISEAGFYDAINKLQQKSAENIQYAKDVNPLQNSFGDNLVEAGVSTIQNAADAAMAVALGLSGTGVVAMIPFALRAYGGSYAEQMQQATELGGMIGQDVAKRAATSAGMSSAIEVGTEMMWGMVGAMSKVTGGGALDDAAQERLTEVLSGWAKTEKGRKVLTFIGEKALGGVTEGLEEVIGDAAEQMLKNAGIMPGEADEFSEWVKNAGHSFVTGALGGLLGETTSIVMSPMQKANIGQQVRNGTLDVNLNDLVDMANAEGMENSALAKTYSELFKGMPRSVESLSNYEVGKLYDAYGETVTRSDEAIERLREMVAKVESGEELKRSDVNKITNNPEVVQQLQEAAGGELNLGGNINERRAAVEMALRAFANGAESANQAQAENVQAATENASTPILQRQMDYNAMMAAARGIRQNTAAEDVRNSLRTEQSLRDNVISSARSVYNAAERLGASDQAQDVMAQMYSPDQNTIDYAGKMTSIYNRAKSGDSLDVSNLDGITMQQAQAVHNVGRMEYLQEEAKNGEESGLRVRNGLQGNDSQSAGGQTEGVEGASGSVELRESTAGFERRRPVSGVYSQPVSAASLGIRGGSNRANIRVLTESKDRNVQRAKQIVEERGYKAVLFTGGALEINGQQARGYYDPETNTMYIRADHRLFTADQIARHEAMHDRIRKQEVDLAAVRDDMIKRMGGVKNFERTMRDYYALYEGTGESDASVFEEAVCDAAGDMNEFMYHGHWNDADAAVSFYKSAKESAKATAKNVTGALSGPVESDVGRYSRDHYDPETAGIKEQIANAADKLNAMEPADTITVPANIKTNREAAEWAINLLKKTGYKIDRQNYGRIVFGEKDIRNGARYATNNAERAAFAAVPSVLKRGIEIGRHNDHKARSVQTITFAAPVVLNGVRGNMAVVINAQGNHYKTHRIVMPDGTTFILEDVKKEDLQRSRGVAENSSLAETTRSSATTVAEQNEPVKGKFSMDRPVEMTKDLVALHNLSEDKLLKAIKLGGFPMPSIAVTKSNIPHTNFGDITLVMNRSTVDPEMDSRNTVYSADAWTPTFPNVEYEANPAAEKRLRDLFYRLERQYGREVSEALYGYGNYLEDQLNRMGGIEGILKREENNTGMMKAYLKLQGKDIPETVVKETVERIDDQTAAFYDDLLAALGDASAELDTYRPPRLGREWFDAHEEQIKEGYRKYFERAGLSEEDVNNFFENESWGRMYANLKKARKYQKEGKETRKTETDYAATEQAVRDAVDQEAYKKWLHEIFDDSVKSEGIYNGRDYYDRNGNRRSFSWTHVPVTLDNIAKAMAAQNDGNSRNVSGFYGVKSLRAGTAERFKSIADMHKLEGRLKHLAQEEADAINDELGNRLSALMQKILDTAPKSYDSNSFMEMDAIGNILMEISEDTPITIDKIMNRFKGTSYKVTVTSATEIRDLLFDISQMPVNIFEAKPERAVRFDEVLAAIVPAGASEELVNGLKSVGVENVMEYEKDNDEDRIAKVNSVEGARFSRDLDGYLMEHHKEYENDETNRKIAAEGVQDLIKGAARVSAAEGEMDMAKQRRDIRTLGNGISAQFVKTGRVNLNGTRIRSAEDLAQVGQIFRNPKFETLRYLYVKKGKIVGTDSVTAMLPGISPAFSKDFQEADLIKKIARTGADGVYLLHNHPSGDVTPSRQDFGVTGKLAETIQNNTKAKFMGHVVIDHETYAQIDVDTNKRTASWEQKTIPGQSSFDFLLAPSLDNENLGKEVLNAGAVAAVGKEVVNSSGYSAIIYASSKGYVRQLQEVSNKALKNNKQIGSYIRNQRVNSGAGMAFVYTKDRTVYDALVQVYGSDILTDVVLDGAEFKDMRKNVFQREGMYMGVKEGEIGGVHANEETAKFSRDLDAERNFSALYTTLEDGRIKPNNVEDLSTEDWKLIYKAVNKLGYGLESAKQAKEVYSRYVGQGGFNKEQSEAIKKAYGVTADGGVAANPKREALARKTFGTTGDFREAGYLMRNGSMLDFSGKKDGGPAHVRYMDHREIGSVFGENEIPEDKRRYGDNSAYMNAFISEGNIRLMDGQGVTIGEMEPTAQQYTMLRQFIDRVMRNEDYFYLDLSNNDGYTVASRDYEGRDGSAKVIRDIKEYFKNGELPYRSNLSAFFSRDLSNGELYEANRQLQKDLTELRSKLKTRTEQRDYWRGQTKVTEGRKLRIDDVTRLAREIIKGQESSADAKAVAEKMKALGEYILNTTDENVYDEARLKAYEIAHEILSNAKVLNEQGGEHFYKDFRDALKQTPIYVTPSVREEVSPDGWSGLRQMAKGIFTPTADKSKGKTVDVIYHDLQSTFGEWLLPEYVTSEADQLNKIFEVVETYQPVYENINSYDMADATEWTANEILTRIIGNEIRETNPTYADRMEKKLSDQKVKSQEALRRVREQRDRKVQNLKEHYQQVAEDRRNRKIDSEMRTRLLHIAKRLNNKKLTRATRSLLDQYIGELDLVSKGILGRTVKELESLQAWYDSYKESMGDDFIPDKFIERKIARLSKRHISDLTQEEVADLTTVLLNIETMIRTQNELIESKIKMDAYAAGVQTIDDINNSNGKTGFLNKFISTETATPEREIHRITGYRENSPLYQAAKELSDGQRKMLDYQMRAEALFKKWTTDKKFIQSIAGKKAEAIIVKGYVDGAMQDVVITPAMRMALYLHSKNDDNMRHIAKGGVKIPNMSLYVKGKIQEAYDKADRVVFTRGMINEIAAHMSDKERAFADAVDRYYNGMSRNEINDTSEALRGYAIAGVDHYYPIDTDGSFLKKEFDAIKRDGSIEGMGILKERIEGATNPIMLYDMNDTLNRSISQHSKYVGLAIPVRNFNKLYSVTTFNYETSVAETLKKNWGSDATKYVEKMMADLQNGTGLASDSWGDLLAKARSHYAGAVLTTNLSVAMKQAASYPTAAAVVGYGPLIKAFADVGKVDLDTLDKYTPLLWYRRKGFSTPELGDIGKEGRQIPKALNWIQGMDVATTTKLVKAAMIYVNENQQGLARNTDAWWKAVAEVYNRIIEETQPNYTMMQRPQILRSDNALTRAIMMFKTQPFQNFNILYDAFGNLSAKSREYKANTTQENLRALKSARTNAVRAVASQAVSAFVFALMQFAWDVFRGKAGKYKDKDDEMTFASWLKGMGINVLSSVGGMIPFGSYVLELGEAMTDAILKGFKKNPVFDQTFYGLSENAAESMNDMGNALLSIINKTTKALQGEATTETTVRGLVDGAADIAQFAGMPVSNVIKLAQSIARNVFLATDGQYLGEYKALRVTTDPAKYSSDYYDLLYKAYNKDKAAYEELVQTMIEDGFTEDKIKNAMETRMKKSQGVNSVSDLESRWMSPNQQSTYDQRLSGLEQTTMFQAATDEQQQALLNKLYNLAVGNSDGKKLDEKIKGGASVGLDQTEYLLFQLALSMSDADGSGKANQEEAEAAALMVPGLSPEERAYLFQSVDSKWKNNPFK